MYFGFCYPTLQYSFVFCSPSIYEHYSTLNSNGIKLYGFCIWARTSSIWLSVLGYFPYITWYMDKYRFYSWLSYYFWPKYYWSLYVWFYATSGIGLPWNLLSGHWLLPIVDHSVYSLFVCLLLLLWSIFIPCSFFEELQFWRASQNPLYLRFSCLCCCLILYTLLIFVCKTNDLLSHWQSCECFSY